MELVHQFNTKISIFQTFLEPSLDDEEYFEYIDELESDISANSVEKKFIREFREIRSKNLPRELTLELTWKLIFEPLDLNSSQMHILKTAFLNPLNSSLELLEYLNNL